MHCILRMLSLEDSKNRASDTEKRASDTKKSVVTSQPKENDKSLSSDRIKIVWYMGDSIVSLSKKN
jgi:hypothetical protein